jgi:hypothetical protein
MNILKKLFGSKTNYPEQVIPEKVQTIINELDSFLVETSENDFTTNFTLLKLECDIFDQFKTTDTIVYYLKTKIQPNYTYIPRTIAFVITVTGTWQFFVGIRRTIPSTIEKISIDMFIDLLSRTNDARINNIT